MGLPQAGPVLEDNKPVSIQDAADVLQEAFDRVLAECATARMCIRSGDVPGKIRAVDQALKIMEALGEGLDYEADPKLCGDLHVLYLHVQMCLFTANRDGTTDALRNAMNVLKSLRGAFVDAARAHLKVRAGGG